MRTVTIQLPDDLTGVRAVDVSVHFEDDLASCESFAKLASDLNIEPKVGYSGLLLETTLDVPVERAEMTYYGPQLRDEESGEHKAKDLLHTRIVQLRSRKADALAKAAPPEDSP